MTNGALSTKRPRAVVVGAGIGGLTAAALLARAGLEVTVLERGAAPGGKMRQAEVGGACFDVGPTVLTMRSVFDRLFADLGGLFGDEVPLVQAEVLARHAWSAGGRLDLFADAERSAAAIADFAGPKAADGFRRFCAYTARIHAEVEGPFIHGPRPTALTLLKARGLGVFAALRNIDSFRSLWRALDGYFPDPRLRQLFARYATYTGSSPFEAPATLNLVAHVEQAGVWQVVGGIHQVASALARRLEVAGGAVRLGCEVSEIEVESGRARGVRLSTGEVVPAEIVVCNAAAEALARGLLGEAAAAAVPRALAPPAGRRSLSALTWATLSPAAGWPLVHHNVAFGDDYPAEFAALSRGQLPPSPTVYVCAQDRLEGAVGPAAESPERLFVLVNAPALGHTGGPETPPAPGLEPEEIAQCQDRMLSQLRACGLELRLDTAATARTTPHDFADRFPGTGGALYGAPTHGWRASLSRPGARTKVAGLYLSGGGAHPGPGVPMVALGGRQAAQTALADLGLTPPWPATATFGGTSMSSIPKGVSG